MFWVFLSLVLAQDPAPEAPVEPEAVEEVEGEAPVEEAPAEEAPAEEQPEEEQPGEESEEAPDAEPPAPSEIEPEDLQEAVGTFQLLVEAVQTGNWAAAGALALTLLIFAIRRFLWDGVPKKHLPYAVIAVAVVGELAAALYLGADLLNAGLSGLAMGMAAIGGWEVFKKHLKKSLKPPSEAPPIEGEESSDA